MITHDDTCPECGKDDTYEAECDNSDCTWCGCLFVFCRACGYTDHPECEEE